MKKHCCGEKRKENAAKLNNNVNLDLDLLHKMNSRHIAWSKTVIKALKINPVLDLIFISHACLESKTGRPGATAVCTDAHFQLFPQWYKHLRRYIKAKIT